MVDIALEHEALLADIAECATSPGHGAFWWLGQHTFILKAGGKVFYFDPWFAPWESRQTRTLLNYNEGRHADIVLVSHGHGDHLCPDTLAQMVSSSPDALFVCPQTERERMVHECKVPADRLRPLNAGETLEHDGVLVTAIKSKHEAFDEDPTLGFPYLGYVVEAGGLTVYHAGDTIMYEGLQSTLQRWPRFDALFLPINGRDAERFLTGCMGNFTFQEAAELAGELRPGLVAPAHYDMFIGNQEDPARFVRFLNAKYPEVRAWVGSAGERVLLG